MEIENQRVLSWFSCGAASAYATYLAKDKYHKNNFEAVYCRVSEEHRDNIRFLKDFENKCGISIKIIGDENFNFSIYRVFEHRKFIKGPTGAPCTSVLKKNVRKKYERPTDFQIFGYTIEEEHRAKSFIDAYNTDNTDFILLEKGVT